MRVVALSWLALAVSCGGRMVIDLEDPSADPGARKISTSAATGDVPSGSSSAWGGAPTSSAPESGGQGGAASGGVSSAGATDGGASSGGVSGAGATNGTSGAGATNGGAPSGGVPGGDVGGAPNGGGAEGGASDGGGGAGTCTDVDCGGICEKCPLDKSCLADSDCISDACDAVSLTCVADPCSDHRQDDNETDADCGGDTCPACDDGMLCVLDGDCTSNACDLLSGLCVWDQCIDHRVDGDESDVDCGGGTYFCARCGLGKTCTHNYDCHSGYTCAVATHTCVLL